MQGDVVEIAIVIGAAVPGGKKVDADEPGADGRDARIRQALPDVDAGDLAGIERRQDGGLGGIEILDHDPGSIGGQLVVGSNEAFKAERLNAGVDRGGIG